MSPRSIAILGASGNIANMGSIQCVNLIGGGYPGEILPVHPREKTVLGRKAWPSISDLPFPPDLAVLVVPPRLVPEMLLDFGRLGTRHAVIISGGFRETGEGGKDLEKRITDIAGEYGMRFVGPNCVGIINTELPLNLTVFPAHDLDGKLGMISQSGTYVTQTLAWLHRRGIEVAREITKTKPVVAQYVGGTEAGARSGSSHTGAIAGPDFVYQGLFEQAGIIAVDSIEDVFRTGWALASQPPLRGKRIAVLTNSGGPGTAASNTLNKLGLDVPEFSKTTQKAIAPYIPGQASARNPVDLTFHLDMSTLAEKLPGIVFEEEDIDGVIIHGIMDSGFLDELFPVIRKVLALGENDVLPMPETDLEPLAAMPGRYGKPLLVNSFFGKEDRCVRIFHEKGIPVFDAPEKAARAMGAFHRHCLIRNRNLGLPVRGDAPPPRKARDILGGAAPGPLDEYRAKRVLAAYGVPVVAEFLAETLPEVLEAAGRIGYPVVLKGCSSHVLHKTEKGLVRLNIRTDDELARAFDGIREREPGIALLVSEMIRGDREFLAGVTGAPGFPPCVLFGLGGVYAEALKDHQVRLAPLCPGDAFEMMDSLRSRDLLGACRGMDPVDREALASILVSLGRLALDFPIISEVDLNPIIIAEGKPRVADALFILGEAGPSRWA